MFGNVSSNDGSLNFNGLMDQLFNEIKFDKEDLKNSKESNNPPLTATQDGECDSFRKGVHKRKRENDFKLPNQFSNDQREVEISNNYLEKTKHITEPLSDKDKSYINQSYLNDLFQQLNNK